MKLGRSDRNGESYLVSMKTDQINWRDKSSQDHANTYPVGLTMSELEARAPTLYVFRISVHTGITHVLFVLAPVVFPLCHVIKSSDKVFASKPLNDLFAAVTDNFNCSDFRARRGFN